MITTTSPSIQARGQSIGIIGLELGLGIGGTFPLSQALLVVLLALFGCAVGGHMILTGSDIPGKDRVVKGCALIGFGLGLGMGGTFPDGTEWITWLMGAVWCALGFIMLNRRTT